jgi:hypothetical protein
LATIFSMLYEVSQNPCLLDLRESTLTKSQFFSLSSNKQGF